MPAANCIGCGREVPIPVKREGKGPFCYRCLTYGRPPSMPKFYPTAFSHWGPEERQAIARVLASEQLTMGPEVAAFEEEFARFHGRRHGIMVNSGSSANLVMIAALVNLGKVKAGDKVAVPAIAWATTYAPLVQHGLDLVLLDVDDTWNADPYARRLRIDDCKLIVGCSILGLPAQLQVWASAAGVVDATFVEDNCESLGAVTPEMRLAGTYGLMSTFSFFYSHQISAIEGGMILTDDDDCAALCRMLRNHGWAKDVDPPQAFEDEYDFRVFGYNVRPLEMHAAIAREQLKKLPLFVSYRLANWDYFQDLVIKAGLVTKVTLPPMPPTASPFGLHFLIETFANRRGLVDALRAADIDCRLPTGGSFLAHKYAQLNPQWQRQETPYADAIHNCGMFLGNAPYDIRDKIAKAVDIMKKVL